MLLFFNQRFYVFLKLQKKTANLKEKMGFLCRANQDFEIQSKTVKLQNKTNNLQEKGRKQYISLCPGII